MSESQTWPTKITSWRAKKNGKDCPRTAPRVGSLEETSLWCWKKNRKKNLKTKTDSLFVMLDIFDIFWHIAYGVKCKIMLQLKFKRSIHQIFAVSSPLRRVNRHHSVGRSAGTAPSKPLGTWWDMVGQGSWFMGNWWSFILVSWEIGGVLYIGFTFCFYGVLMKIEPPKRILRWMDPLIRRTSPEGKLSTWPCGCVVPARPGESPLETPKMGETEVYHVLILFDETVNHNFMNSYWFADLFRLRKSDFTNSGSTWFNIFQTGAFCFKLT